VLVVEKHSHPGLQASFRRISGLEVRAMDDARAACEYMSAGPGARGSCVMVMDLDSMEEAGFELLASVRRSCAGSEIPVIVFTECGEAAAIERAYSLGASTCLRKTCDTEAMDEIARGVRDLAGILKQRNALIQ
jgi:DNA-binding NarL/FixJ family response regulator